jgi:hypothetical protein
MEAIRRNLMQGIKKLIYKGFWFRGAAWKFVLGFGFGEDVWKSGSWLMGWKLEGETDAGWRNTGWRERN